MTWALAAAVGASIGYGVASVLQAVGARRSGGLSALADPWTLTGLALDGVAWLVSLVALRALPLVVVQSVLAGSLVVTAVLARLVLGARLRRADVAAIVVAVVALGLLTAAATEQPSVQPPAGFVGGAVVASGVLVAATALAYRRGPGALLAVLGGLGYSGAALAARGAVARGSLLATLAQPLVGVLVVCGAVGVAGFLRALERDRVGPMTALSWVAEVVVPSVVGVVLLGDRVRPGWALPAVGAVLAATVACAVLATAPAEDGPGRTGPGPVLGA